jgi:phosphate transport system permease protein
MTAPPSSPLPPAPPSQPAGGRRAAVRLPYLGDLSFRWLCQLSALSTLLLAVLLCVVLLYGAGLAIEKLGWRFLIDREWDTVHHLYGALVFLYGSVMTSAIAMLIAVPLGVGTAAFLAEIAPGWLRRGGSFLVELLAAIPSVVYGFWGITFLAPYVQKLFTLMGGPNTGGKGILSAGLILAIMVVPYITAVAYDVCQAVPRAQREGALALGATRWQMIWRVVLPYARPGIIGGCFLGLGRAVGETMAVTMLIGNANEMQALPFGRGNTIPSVIAQQLAGWDELLQESALIALALVLFGLTVVINLLARFLIWRVGRPGRTFSRLGLRAPRGRAGGPLDSEADGYAPLHRRLRRKNGKARVVNHMMTGVLGLCLAVTVVPLFLILGYITYRGVGALNWAFFTELPRPMGETGGGLANALYGSFMMVGLATLFAVPLGILAAIFLGEHRRHPLVPVVRFVGELLNGVPSIVMGTFVYALIHFLIHRLHLLSPRQQFSGWAGAFVLGLMMIPIVMRGSEEALKLVPQSLRNASYALGAQQWQTVLRVTVPAAMSAIITAVLLAIARIAGETAPLLMTAFGNDLMPRGPGDKTPALPVYIYNYSTNGDPYQEQQAWAAAMVLLTFVMLLNVGIRLLTGRRVVLASRAD